MKKWLCSKYREGLQLMVISNIENKTVLLAIEYAVENCYDLKYPVYFNFSKNLFNDHGKHHIKHTEEYERLPPSFTQEDRDYIMDNHNGHFHYIALSHNFYKTNKQKVCTETSWWNYNDLYGSYNVKQWPLLCWLSTVITHELEHAWQADDLLVGYRLHHKKIKEGSGLEDVWVRNVYEYDAEIESTKKRMNFFGLMKSYIKENGFER